MGCVKSIIPELQKKYGDKLLQWVQAEVGNHLLKDRFGASKKDL